MLELEPFLDRGVVRACSLLRVACLEYDHEALPNVRIEVAIDSEVFVDALHLGDVAFETL